MMTTTKQNQHDRHQEEFSKSKFRRNPILWFILASVLVHGVGSMVFILIERSPLLVQKNTKPTPIDFVVIPPEESPTEEPSKPAADTLPKREDRPGKAIEPEPPVSEKPEPIAPSQAVPKAVPPPPKLVAPPQTAATPKKNSPTSPIETKPFGAKEPEPTSPSSVINTPTESQTTSEILSGSDRAIEKPKQPEAVKPPANLTKPEKKSPIKTASTPQAIEPPTNITEPEKISPVETAETKPSETPQPKQPATNTPASEDTSVATRLPPKITPTPSDSSATPPAAENQPPPTETGAASLLGGGIKRSLEDDSGESFFDLQANAERQAYNPALLDGQQSIDMRKYFSEIQRRVRRNWNPNAPMEEYTTVLSFSVQRNGQITGLEVFQSSGSAEIDREALEAVQNSAPFDPLPESFPLDSVNIGFNFNIYIY